ncbi:MAG: rhomboid family intramembrane serine protease [Candidatus Bathyarchaeia archaeon]
MNSLITHRSRGYGEKPKVTISLIALNLTVYAALALACRSPFKLTFQALSLLGQSNASVLRGAYWQLLTSLFVHSNILHLLGNMFFLLIFGLRAEDLFPASKYLFIYLASGLCGNLLTLLMGPYILSVGASGAIFGLYGASVIYLRRSMRRSILGALIYSIYLLLFNLGENVNLLSHVGGLTAGLTIGYLLSTFKYRR